MARARGVKLRPSEKRGRMSMAERTVKSVSETLWRIEAELDLLNWRAGDIAVWPLLRFHFFTGAMVGAGVLEGGHPGADRVRRGKIARLLERQRDRWLRTPTPPVAKRPAALIPLPRKIGGADIYSAALLEGLGGQVALFDSGREGLRLPGAYDLEAFEAAGRSARRRGRRLYDAAARRRGDRLAEATRDALGVDLSGLLSRADRAVGKFAAARARWRRYFQSAETERLFVVCAYLRQAAIAGAQEAGVKTIELQHGVISPYHPGYSWPGRPQVPYAPETLWSFGSFWTETVDFPGGVDFQIIGAPYLKRLAAVAAGPRDPNMIVVTSQGAISSRLWPLAIACARARPDKRFVYRLHPSESLNSYEQRLAETPDAPANLSLSARSPNIFALLAEAGAQIGMYSTTLFEGAALGCPAIVVDGPGAGYMTASVAAGHMSFARNAEEAAALLDAPHTPPDTQCYYADPLSPAELARL